MKFLTWVGKLTYVQAGLIGVGFAVLYTITWLASFDSFKDASYILYRDINIIPAISTGIVMAVTIGTFVMIPYWVDYAKGMFESLVQQPVEFDDDEESEQDEE